MTSTNIHNIKIHKCLKVVLIHFSKARDSRTTIMTIGSGSINNEPKITKPRTMATDPTETKPMTTAQTTTEATTTQWRK